MQRYTDGAICTCDETTPRRAVRCLVDSHALSFLRHSFGSLSLRTATPAPGAATAEILQTEAIPHGAGRGGTGVCRTGRYNVNPYQVCVFLRRWNGRRQRTDE